MLKSLVVSKTKHRFSNAVFSENILLIKYKHDQINTVREAKFVDSILYFRFSSCRRHRSRPRRILTPESHCSHLKTTTYLRPPRRL